MPQSFVITKLVNVGTVTLGRGKDDPVACAAKLAGADFADSLTGEQIKDGAVQTYEFTLDEVDFSITLTANRNTRPDTEAMMTGEAWEDAEVAE